MIEKIYTGYPILDFLENDFVKNLKKIKNFKEDTDKNLDFLAKKYCNNIKYWWIIALYNDIVDPFNVDKSIIKIPEINEVESILLDLQVQKGLK